MNRCSLFVLIFLSLVLHCPKFASARPDCSSAVASPVFYEAHLDLIEGGAFFHDSLGTWYHLRPKPAHVFELEARPGEPWELLGPELIEIGNPPLFELLREARGLSELRRADGWMRKLTLSLPGSTEEIVAWRREQRVFIYCLLKSPPQVWESLRDLWFSRALPPGADLKGAIAAAKSTLANPVHPLMILLKDIDDRARAIEEVRRAWNEGVEANLYPSTPEGVTRRQGLRTWAAFQGFFRTLANHRRGQCLCAFRQYALNAVERLKIERLDEISESINGWISAVSGDCGAD